MHRTTLQQCTWYLKTVSFRTYPQVGAGGETRTRTHKHQILNLTCLPFHHTGVWQFLLSNESGDVYTANSFGWVGWTRTSEITESKSVAFPTWLLPSVLESVEMHLQHLKWKKA